MQLALAVVVIEDIESQLTFFHDHHVQDWKVWKALELKSNLLQVPLKVLNVIVSFMCLKTLRLD